MTTANENTLTSAYALISDLRKSICELDASYKTDRANLVSRLEGLQTRINQSLEGLDADKVALAETVIYVRGSYAKAGDDRASVLRDAINELATSDGGRLWRETFGTKSYDRWYGQRSDHPYGYGPRHGSLIFEIGLTRAVRARPQKITPDEIEAAIYYLTHLERIQRTKEREAA